MSGTVRSDIRARGLAAGAAWARGPGPQPAFPEHSGRMLHGVTCAASGTARRRGVLGRGGPLTALCDDVLPAEGPGSRARASRLGEPCLRRQGLGAAVPSCSSDRVKGSVQTHGGTAAEPGWAREGPQPLASILHPDAPRRLFVYRVCGVGVWQSDPAVRLIAGFLEGPVGSSEPSRVAGAVAAWPEPVGAWPRQEGVLASRPAWRTEQRRSHHLGISCTCSSDPASLSPRSNP